MSFPDPTAAPPHPYPYMSPAQFSGEAPFWMGGNDHQQNPNQNQNHFEMMPQFDQSHPFKKAVRPSEKAPNFPPQMNNPRMNPQINNKGTSHIFFKTRICAKFKEGTCRNGENCTFAHGEEDLREPPPNWQDMIREKEREERGLGGGSWGDDQRMIHRMKICKKYFSGEECPYGEKCNFLHERPSPPMKKLKVDVPGQRESAAISIGTTAIAGEFEQAAFWKTRLCSKWEMGQCPYGEKCHFAHGLSDLRFSPDEAEVAVNGAPVPRKSTPTSSFVAPPPANSVAAAAATANEDAEEKAKSKWKLTKKVNRIYADWLDDMSPPHSSPEEKDEMYE